MNTSNDWREVTLGEVAEIAMGQSPTSDTYNQENIGIPFYQGVVDFGDRFVTPRIYCSAPKKAIAAGHILLSVRAPVGRINFTSEACAIGRGNAGLKIKNGQQHFLFYMLRYCAKGFEANSSGTVFAAISKSDIENFRIKFPPLREQKAIAEVLSSLDDKIDLLRRQNQTLKELARIQFDHLFVEKSGKNWRVGTLRDLAEIEKGKKLILQEKNYLEIGDINLATKDYNIEKKEKLSAVAAVKVPKNTLLISKVRPTRGAVTITKSETNVSSAFARIKLQRKYVYFVIDNNSFFQYLGQVSTGSTYPICKNEDILKYQIRIPETSALNKFEKDVESVFEKIQTNRQTIYILETLRDILLPKLLSGKIKIKPS